MSVVQLERPAVDADVFLNGLETDGFVVIRDLVPAEPLRGLAQQLTDEYARLVADGTLFRGGGSYSGHLNCFPGAGSRFVLDELEAKGIVDLIRRFRPAIADAPRPTVNFNLPGSVAQHYHMDGAYLSEFLICNVALVDTDLENGAIDVLPGTHRRFYEFWRYALTRQYRRSTRVPMRVGDVIVRRSTVWHRGMPNRSQRPRPMMAITFGEVEPESDPFMHNGGEIEFYANWFRTGRLGQLRERTYVAAPVTYSAYRFARSLVGKKGYEPY